MSTLAGLALLVAMGVLGVALLRRSNADLDGLELLAYGFPLGIVAASLVLLAAASVAGTLRGGLVAATGVASLGLAAALWPRRGANAAHQARGGGPIGWAAVLALALVAIRLIDFWRAALIVNHDGLWAGSVYLWADWAQHLGDVTAFAYGDNFPPTHPRLAGQPFAYHYLSSLTVAAMVRLGLDPLRALPLHSGVLSLLLTLGIFAFARRLTGSPRAAALALLLFLLGGSLGWWLQLAQSAETQEGWRSILSTPWEPASQAAANLQWKNMFLALIAPQRALLYGLPLGLLTLTLLFSGVSTGRRRSFVLAGVAAGLLPFAHLGTLLALALLTPVLCLLFPRRQWVLFFGVWLALAIPQVLLQQDGPGAAGAMRVQLGWLAAPDAWLLFWLKNVGLLIPLSALALARADLMVPGARRFLAAFMAIFVVANVVVFQPWAWDNTKVLAYWFLACCILVAALFTRRWASGRIPERALITVALATLVLSGLLEHLNQMLGRDRHLLLTAEELLLADAVRARTPARAVFAVGLRHNHPIPMLTGRRVIVGYPGWMWSQGLDYRDREGALHAIFALTPDALGLIRRYGVDYVAIGPDECERLAADVRGYRARFPELLHTRSYEIFAASSGEEGATPPASSAPVAYDPQATAGCGARSTPR